MKVLRSYDSPPAHLCGSALAIGNFDGVHRGHQTVLARTRELAASISGPAGVLLFDPHPRAFFQPDAPMFVLTPLREKLRLLELCGLDLSVVLEFNAALSGLSAERFVTEVLVDGLGVSHVVIGYDFHFGKARQGTPGTMREMGRRHGFGVTVIDPQGDDTDAFSSSRIRALLREGDVRAAAGQLGHWWRVSGPVVGGAGRGAGLGYPTANIDLAPGQELAHGIYAVRVEIDGSQHDGAAYLGTRPTFDDGTPVLEVFLLDFADNLYGKTIAIDFVARIRGDETFASPAALAAQMQRDCEQARRQLAAIARDDPMADYPIGRARAPAG